METKKRLRRRCEYCKNVYDVRRPTLEDENLDENMITYQPDPFQSEIHGDNTRYWLCDDCADESAMDI